MTDRPLDDVLWWCVEGFVARSPEWLGAEATADTPDERQQRLYEAINTLRSQAACAHAAELRGSAVLKNRRNTACQHLGKRTVPFRPSFLPARCRLTAVVIRKPRCRSGPARLRAGRELGGVS